MWNYASKARHQTPCSLQTLQVIQTAIRLLQDYLYKRGKTSISIHQITNYWYLLWETAICFFFITPSFYFRGFIHISHPWFIVLILTNKCPSLFWNIVDSLLFPWKQEQSEHGVLTMGSVITKPLHKSVSVSTGYIITEKLMVRASLGSITSRCSGKWARTHPPEGGSRPDPGDGGNRA